MNQKESHDVDWRVEITGNLDPHATEILQLEIRRLAKSCGAVLKTLRLEKAVDED